MIFKFKIKNRNQKKRTKQEFDIVSHSTNKNKLLKSRYDPSFNTKNKIMKEYRINELNHILNFDDIKEWMLILEVGCGSGVYTQLLCERFNNIIGIDISMELIHNAKDACPNAHFILADAEFLPFRKSVFDVCINIDILHHLPERSAVIKEEKMVLKDDGKLLILERNDLNPLIFLWNRFDEKTSKIMTPKKLMENIKQYFPNNYMEVWRLFPMEIMFTKIGLSFPFHLPVKINNSLEKVISNIPMIKYLMLIRLIVYTTKNSLYDFQNHRKCMDTK